MYIHSITTYKTLLYCFTSLTLDFQTIIPWNQHILRNDCTIDNDTNTAKNYRFWDNYIVFGYTLLESYDPQE
jgi:hypothetical protein